MNPKQFAETFGPCCQAAMKQNGGFASVRMAQIALESAWGDHSVKDAETGRESYNLTGVKGEGPAGSVRSKTWEHINGQDITVVDTFAAYHSFEEHIILRDEIFYVRLPENYAAYRNAPTPEDACWGLQNAPMPYATDPTYASKLINIINTYGFTAWDLEPQDMEVNYDFTPGMLVEIQQVSAGAGLKPLRFYGSWRRTWSHIVPGRFSGGRYADLLLYDSANGSAEFYRTDGTGLLQLLTSYPTWRRTWTHIIPGRFSSKGYTDLLLYDASNAQVELYATDGQGGMELLATHADVAPCDLIVPVQFTRQGYTALLFYHRESGAARLYTTDGRGSLTPVRDYTWRSTWRHIVAGGFSDSAPAGLLFYDADAGTVEVYTLDEQGSMGLLSTKTGWGTGCTALVPGQFTGGPRTDLLFYDAAAGLGTFVSPDATGNLATVRQHDGWRNTWRLIVPGDFGGNPRTDLLFYDPDGKEGGIEPA